MDSTERRKETIIVYQKVAMPMRIVCKKPMCVCGWGSKTNKRMGWDARRVACRRDRSKQHTRRGHLRILNRMLGLGCDGGIEGGEYDKSGTGRRTSYDAGICANESGWVRGVTSSRHSAIAAFAPNRLRLPKIEPLQPASTALRLVLVFIRVLAAGDA